MVSRKTVYFERSGKENTEAVLEVVAERLKEGDIKSVVVASSRGGTGLAFARRLAGSTNLIVVSSHPGRNKPGEWDFDREALKELEGMGCKVLRQTHIFAGLERSISGRFSGISHTEVIAESLRTLFATGIKVAIECTIMAADGGVIPIEKTIAVGGTAAHGRGADCAIVALPAHSNNFFDLRVLEILAKPF